MSLHLEHHVIQRLGWLRAAVLGANDGVLSMSSLIIGLAGAQGARQAILTAGLSGLVRRGDVDASSAAQSPGPADGAGTVVRGPVHFPNLPPRYTIF